MTKAVFFDFYNTLVRLQPPREEVQLRVLQEFHIEASAQAIRRAIPAADDYFYREASRSPVEKRPEAEKMAVYVEYERRILKGAEIEVSPQLTLDILARLQQIPTRMVLFEDAPACLAKLRELGIVVGLVSNVERNMSSLYRELGIAKLLDFVLTSVECPPGKPHPAIFLAALEKAGARPQEAIHVGDQYHIDVVGASGVGIRPLLLDRDDFYTDVKDCARIKSLSEVERHV